jgi:hypothetical protein
MNFLTPCKAMRAKCLDCSAGSYNEVKLCPMDDCPLYPYRFGHRPARSTPGPPKVKNPRPTTGLFAKKGHSAIDQGPR